MPSPSAAPAADAIASIPWAEVRAREHVMRYRRFGHGRAVLVLCGSPPFGVPWAATLAALAERARVVVPDVEPGVADGAARLLEFLEGLGGTDVAVVATAAYAATAVELALRDAGQVTRLALVLDPVAGSSETEGLVTTLARDAALPLLVLRAEPGEPQAGGASIAARLATFVAHDAPAPGADGVATGRREG